MAKYGRTIKWKKTYQGFSDALANAGEHLTRYATRWMEDAVEESLQKINSEWPRRVKGKNGASFGGDRFHPWYTGTMHDSVAGIVSDKNHVVSIRYMPAAAEDNQDFNGQTIIGVDWALMGAQNISRALRFASGIYATIVVSVPYAKKVDETSRHAGFIRELNNDFIGNIEEYFRKRQKQISTTKIVASNKKKK